MHNTNEILTIQIRFIQFKCNKKWYIAFKIMLIIHVHIELYNFKWKKIIINKKRKYTVQLM